MLMIENNFIKLTKGDSASLHVNLVNDEGQQYEMQNGDVLIFTVRKNSTSPVIVQVISQTDTIELKPEHTKLLKEGSCVYDIELVTSGGNVYTVVGITKNMLSNMYIMSEVTE